MKSNKIKDDRIKEIIKRLAAEFLERESNGLSLITVTDVRFNYQNNKASVLLSVLPEDKEEQAIEFAKRKRSEFREYADEHSKIPKLPYFDFEIDQGEKNRQKMESLSAL